VKRYQLTSCIAPGSEGDTFAVPMKNTLRVTAELDPGLNRVWLMLVMLAVDGEYGPFAPDDLQRAFADHKLDDPGLGVISRALQHLERLELVTTTE
jgi:hypothetical protein